MILKDICITRKCEREASVLGEKIVNEDCGDIILSKEQAIIEHCKMFKYIAMEIERYKVVFDIEYAKKVYMEAKSLDIRENCFLCEYVFDRPCCGANVRSGCLEGLCEKISQAKTWQEQAALARQIAELPERDDV